jgi:NAD(P)-dependent dehydrogenase (short-subunit alcohol dehydrogenase family)
MVKVFITAGASGIGRAMATAFDASGAQVWVSDIDAEALSTCPPHWRKDQMDVSDSDAVAGVFARIASEWGAPDVVCCNAGVAGPTARLEDIEIADWRACINVTLDGAFLTAKHAAQLMKPRRTGAILFTSSTAGLYGYPNRAPYAAAKWALHGLMKTVAMELGPFGIRSNVICPGAVEGPRMEQVLHREAGIKGTTRDAIYAGYASGTSMRSFVRPEDIANMAVFLASDQARLVSGQIIAVDGHTENPDPKV